MASEAPAHLVPINNDEPPSSTGPSTFTPFTRLPKELRLKIWNLALSRHRLIHVQVNAKTEILDLRMSEYRDRLPRRILPAAQQTFLVRVDSRGVSPKLTYVSREAREETLRFYRVRIPCSFKDVRNEEDQGTLYFNPEHDMLRIIPGWPVQDTVINLLYHLKATLDPRQVGLLNLAADGNCLNGMGWSRVTIPELDEKIANGVRDTLAQLQQVFLVTTPLVGRQLLGWKSGIGSLACVYNRSWPIEGNVSTFKRLPQDPRPIGQDLKQLYWGTRSEAALPGYWRQLLDTFGIVESRADVRHLLTFGLSLGVNPLADRESAHTYLVGEENRWRTEGGDTAQNEDLDSAVRPAIGFWLFPVQAFTDSRLSSNGLIESVDLSAYSPELGLMEWE